MARWAAGPGKILEHAPLVGVRVPAVAYQGERSPAADQVAEFLAWLDRQPKPKSAPQRFEAMLKVMIRLIVETGCRPGEACCLWWEWFTPAERVILIPPEHWKCGRNGRSRILILSPEMTVRLEAIRHDPDHHRAFIFTHKAKRKTSAQRPYTEQEKRRGVPYSVQRLTCRIAALRRRAIEDGLPLKDRGIGRLHSYALRHGSITEQIRRGRNINDMAALHGTSIRLIEQTYLHPRIDHLRRVVESDRRGD
jgi:integrase